MGIDLLVLGEKEPGSPTDEVVTFSNPMAGVYKKLIVRDGVLVGGILLGDPVGGPRLLEAFHRRAELPGDRADLLFPPSITAGEPARVVDAPGSFQVCNCNGVSKTEILNAIRSGCATMTALSETTRAGTGCGSCKSQLKDLLEAEHGGPVTEDPSVHFYVPAVPMTKPELVRTIRERGLKSVSAVLDALSEGAADPESKAGLASLLKILWGEDCKDERDARFINDRVHANIQKDGTFSVVPRIYAGVTTADELMRIARVAVKYDVPTVKITGGQRIDLLGIKKEDLPGVWKDLGMPSGHAYTKAFRTCKSCVGTDFCRYGVGDSIALAQKIERRFQGVESPHKMKLATAGCPRNCSEAYVKDLGAVAIDGGEWEIYLGGAAGGTVRKGDLLCTVKTHDEVLKYMGRFIQYYREHGRYLERSYHFLERVGIDNLRKILVEDSLGICVRLDADIQKAVDAYVDPWQEAEEPAYHAQFKEAELAYALEVAENNG
jgi:nitrite reductase (NADH) large subunit